MKQKLNEEFNYDLKTFKTKNGKDCRILVIEPSNSQNTYDVKDTLKNQFDGKFFDFKNGFKGWGWYLNPDGSIPEKAKQAMEYLQQLETVDKSKYTNDDGSQMNDEDIEQVRSIATQIDNLVARIQDGDFNTIEDKGMSANEIKEKLIEFKAHLLEIVGTEEFQQEIYGITSINSKQGPGSYNFSFLNKLLIYIQRRDANLVASKSDWAKWNRRPKADAVPIKMWRPTKTRQASKQEIDKYIDLVCRKNNWDRDKLSPIEIANLEKHAGQSSSSFFTLDGRWFDISDTEVVNPEDNDPASEYLNREDRDTWYDYSMEPTETSEAYVNALIQFIETDAGIKVGEEGRMSLGGAKGVSYGDGHISLQAGTPKNAGLLDTLIHECTHSLMHQRAAQTKNPALQEFYNGETGRARKEQQAELSAWIVMKMLHYDMPTDLNYVSNWGMKDTTTAAAVFDEVAKTANFIYDGIMKYSQTNNGLQESIQMISERINGHDVAELVAQATQNSNLVDEYEDGEQKLQAGSQEEIVESFYSILATL